jgi:DNA-binding MarR family transcriptional regulator
VTSSTCWRFVPVCPTIGELAGYLLLRHHSTVELVNRTADAGLVRRIADRKDGRIVRVRLTARGERSLAELTPAHLKELDDLARSLNALLQQTPNAPVS